MELSYKIAKNLPKLPKNYLVAKELKNCQNIAKKRACCQKVFLVENELQKLPKISILATNSATWQPCVPDLLEERGERKKRQSAKSTVAKSTWREAQ